MFVRTKDFDPEMADLRAELKMLSEKYYKLYHKHERLMTHLGLYEHERRGVEIRKKGGPEQGEQE